MDSKKAKIVNIINRDYPPYTGITGESAAELAKYLLNEDFQVNIIHIDAPFWGKSDNLPVGNIFKVKTLYYGANRYLRLLANFVSGYFLIRMSKKIPCDLTIVMTDPSLLNMWASLLLKKNKWILWAMDLYPESFVAGRLISATNIFYKTLYQWTIKNAPRQMIALGPLQREFLRGRYKGCVSDFHCIPCGIYDANESKTSDRPQWVNDPTKIYLGYCGNLGAAHSLDFLFAIVNNLDTNKFKLVLSVYGVKAAALKQYVQGKNGIEIIPPVKREHLKYIDIHLASLLPQWTHISVPSKTVSSVCAGSAFLYYGNEESDNWFLLKNAGWLIPYGLNIEDGVKTFFQQFSIGDLTRKKKTAIAIAQTLNKEKIEEFQKIVTNNI